MTSNKKQQQHQQQRPPQEPPQASVTTSPPQQRPNMAAGVDIPPMAPAADQYIEEPEPRDPYEQPEAAPQPGPRGRVPERRRMSGRRPMRGIGQPQVMAHRDITNHAHGMLEAYKQDPTSVDPTFVGIMQLEAMAAYGGQVDSLKQEVARLRKEVEAYRGAEPPAPQGGGRPSVRLGRIARRRNGAARPGARGRGRRS